MRFGLTLRRLLGALALCILTEAKGLAGDLSLLPPNDSICEGNVLITTQAEWDLFASDYAGCTTFLGDITIDNSLAEIDSVYGLDSVSVMVGDWVVDFAGYSFPFNGLNGLDSLAGDLSLMDHSERFDGLNNLRNAGKILLENTNVSPGYDSGDNYIQSFAQLTSCESILISGSTAEVVGNFSQLREAQKIQIELLEYPPIIEQSFSNIITCDSIFIRASLSWFSQNFNNLTEAGFVDLGDNQYFLGIVENSFESLITVDEIKIVTNELATTFPSLTHANKIWLEGFGFDYSLEYPLLNALIEVSADMLISVSRRNLEFDHLTQVGGNLTLLNMPVVETVSLPNLTDIEGWFGVVSSDEGSLFNSITAPILTHIGGTIDIAGALLTTCVCPAFCESTNYSPQWASVYGGPGCSSVEEIQAQCVSICPDIDSNGICDSVQTQYIGDLIFSTESAIDSFFNAFPSIHFIEGDVTFLFPHWSDWNSSIPDTISTLPFLQIDTISGALILHGGGSYWFDSYSAISGLHLPANELSHLNLNGFNNLISLDSLDLYGIFSVITENQENPGELFPSLQACNNINLFSSQSEYISGFNSLTQCGNIAINCPRFEEPEMQGTTFYQLPGHNYISSSWTIANAFQNLGSCANLGFCRASVDSSCWYNLINTGKLYMALSQVSTGFNNLLNLTSLFMEIDISIPENSFSSLQTAEFIDLGEGAFISNISFPNLNTAFAVSFSFDESLQSNPEESTSIFSINLPAIESLDYLIFQNSTNNPFIIDLHNCQTIGTILMANFNQSEYEILSLSLPPEAIIENLNIIEYPGTNLNFLDQQIHIANINIEGAPNLVHCAAHPVCELISNNPSNLWISGAPGCSSIEEIQAQCLGSYASGTVYYDLDCDQQFNNDDALVSYPILLQGDTLPIGSSGEAGYFFVPLELNSTTALFAQLSSDWSIDGPITLTTTDSLQVFTDLQIGLCPVTLIHDVAVSVNASMNPRPGFTVRYNMVAQNLWPGSDSASVVFNIAQMPGAVITGYASGGTQEGNQVSFTTNLLYGQSQTLWVDVLVPVGTPLGTAYTATATITLNDAQAVDSHSENNTYTLNQTVIGSYDPNDKLVTPTVVDLLDLDATGTELLEYTIRFQNTGTAEAIFVRVLDTLSSALNPATFELIATSHPSEITFNDNHVIEWFFDNIMLPDSFSNEPGSHGFIQFRIQTLPLSEPFALENEAAIYFDFNEPVITPPAVTAVVICAEAGDACDDGDACTISDLIQPDCSCAGTFADADSDGICDASEIAGCTEIEACNYNALATDDDGSCIYVELFSIAGNTNPVASIEESYTYPGPPTSNYQWSITPGTIQSGQGTAMVSVIWDDALQGTLQVTETNEAECLGSTVMLEVNITPSAISAWNTESIIVYPNPASEVLHIAGDIPSNAQASISNGLGQCVYLGTLASAIDVRSLAAGVYYLRIQHNGTVDSVKFTIVRE